MSYDSDSDIHHYQVIAANKGLGLTRVWQEFVEFVRFSWPAPNRYEHFVFPEFIIVYIPDVVFVHVKKGYVY